MMTLNKQQEEQLNKAFEAICNMYIASEKDNHSLCGSFHIKPFNSHWDKRTVKEVMYGVKLYIGTWVIPKMEAALNKRMSTIEKTRRKEHKAAMIRKKEWELTLK